MCGLSCHKIGRRQRYTSSPTHGYPLKPWFCRACKEGNKYCGRLVKACPPPGDPAPTPTLEAWAQRSPNVYTQIFSREEACGGYAALVAGPTRLDADAYARAAAALAAPDMLVLTTEDLDNSWGRLDTYLGRQPGAGVTTAGNCSWPCQLFVSIVELWSTSCCFPADAVLG